MKTTGIRMNVPPNLEHLNEYKSKDHCVYCNTALYKMQYNMKNQQFLVEQDKDRYENSNDQPICKPCNDRLIKKGTIIECSKCDSPIYSISHDMFREDQLNISDLRGIHPQHNPVDGETDICVHCKTTIEWSW